MVDVMKCLEGITRRRWSGSPGSGNPHEHCAMPLRNRVQWEQFGPEGELKATGVHEGNILATYGLNRLAAMLATDAGGASAFANYCIIGTDTTAAASTNTALGASTASAGTFSRAVNGVSVNYTATFASANNAATINEIGLFQTNTYTGSLIARSVLGTASINRGLSDVINVTYTIIASTA